MKTTHLTSRSQQPALKLSDAAEQAPSLDRIHQDMTIYLRRGHKARSEAFHQGLKALGSAIASFGSKLASAGTTIESWLFTPVYNGGRKS